jgi:hypothetical protein
MAGAAAMGAVTEAPAAARAGAAFAVATGAAAGATAGTSLIDRGPLLRGRSVRSSPHDEQRGVPSAAYMSQLPQTMPISSAIGSTRSYLISRVRGERMLTR